MENKIEEKPSVAICGESVVIFAGLIPQTKQSSFSHVIEIRNALCLAFNAKIPKHVGALLGICFYSVFQVR